MQAKIEKANRPKYFTHNGVCIRIDNIIFVQKSDVQYGRGEGKECSVEVGVSSSQFPPKPIPCKDEVEQTAVFTELTTILAAL
ncbi:MAG TPA: hypothetical protein VHP31_11850 [Caproicibacter sp.]|nr:hypothetical protein [Caproicibacter sp.]